MVRIGLTGATGYIGGALVPFLHARGYDLRPVDNRTGPVRAEHRAWPVPSWDFASEEALRWLSDCDVVLHLGAASGVMMCVADPAGTSRVNVDGTRRLYSMCRERKIPVAFASSFAVVGAPEHLPVVEGTPARPTHEYARQKVEGERLTAQLARDAAVPTVNLRQSNVYGTYETAEGALITKGNVLEMFARQAAEGRLLVNAPGTQRRDFLHIGDAVAHWEAAARFLLRPSSPHSATTFNAASGEALSVLELADDVVRAYAQLHPTVAPVRVEVVPNPRQGIELVEGGFSVDRSWTERELGLSCGHHIGEEIPKIVGRARKPVGVAR